MDEELARRAAAAGLEPEYWDALGVHRVLGEDTARALLTALEDAPAHGHARTKAPLAPLVCVEFGRAVVIECELPRRALQAPVAWRCLCEDGTCATGSCLPRLLDTVGDQETLRCVCEPGGLELPCGYHRFELPDFAAQCTLVVTPASAWIPPQLQVGARRWGLAVQVYALRSARNWGMGDFTDLARVVAVAARGGAALVGVNPLHARHLAEPHEASPYAPASRYALDPLYLDVEAVPEVAASAAARALLSSATFRDDLARVRAAPLVDHAAVAALKLPVLRAAFDDFARAGEPARQAEFASFRAAGGALLAGFATCEAMRLAEQDAGGPSDWRRWPAPWREPGSAEVAAWARTHAAAVAFVCWLQWQADAQLGQVADTARAAGMSIGLYRDVAVGAAPSGGECWAAGELVAHGASTGAPPDLLNHNGQDWGLPPWRPPVLAARGLRPWADLLAANMRHAGALRIDHVMALRRLFWIPAGHRGEDGAYLRQPFECLAGVVALESQRRHCLVVGEDLGSVPDGLREALAARGLLSYRVLVFERHWDGDGSFKRPWEYPRQALATVVTHDMPTIAEYWSGDDIARREALGLYPEPGFGEDERERREHERAGLAALAGELELELDARTSDTVAVTDTLHALVARTESMLAVVQLDDVSGEDTPINVPGTYDEYPNWRRKLALALEDLEQDPRWRTLVATMRAGGRAER